jgi:hypothetical protein
MQVVTITLKDIVFLQSDFDAQVTRLAAIGSRLTVAAVLRMRMPSSMPCRYFDFQGFLFFDFALAVTWGARVGDGFAACPGNGGRFVAR